MCDLLTIISASSCTAFSFPVGAVNMPRTSCITLGAMAMASGRRSTFGLKGNHKLNGGYTSLCWIRGVFGSDPRHPRCWDPIAKHISTPDVATSYFEL